MNFTFPIYIRLPILIYHSTQKILPTLHGKLLANTSISMKSFVSRSYSTSHRSLEVDIEMKYLETAFVVVVYLIFARGDTNPQDDAAIRSLYISLNMPQLGGWNLTGGDPCGEMWQGIQCSGPNVVAIQLSGLHLRGSLELGLYNLTNLLALDLSSNHIGRMIPDYLPLQIQQMNLGSNVLIGGLPLSLKNLTFLTSLNLSGNLLSGNLPDIFQNFTNLTALDLSSNNFSGEFPASFTNLSSLQTLHLQDDQLNGTLEALAQLPLKDLNIEANDFSGPVPPELLNIPNFRYNGNHLDLNQSGGNSTPPSPGPITKSPSSNPLQSGQAPQDRCQGHQGYNAERRCFAKGRLVAIVIAASVAMLSFLLLLSLLSRWRSRTGSSFRQCRIALSPSLKASSTEEFKGLPNEKKAEKSEATVAGPHPIGPRQTEKPTESFSGSSSNSKSIKFVAEKKAVVFSLNELQLATHNFSQDNLVGEGMLGPVYKAELANGQVLAIRRLDNPSRFSHTYNNFMNLISNISRLQHENIAELVGYCINDIQLFLVYPYHKQGTVQDLFHYSPRKEELISWSLRMKIALGAARALEYLHHACVPPVIHRSFKSANILLDDQFNPKLTDCGLHPLVPLHAHRQVSYELLDSFGYSAPEYVLYGVYVVKSDVFSFGVLLLELLTGRKALDRSKPPEQYSLVRWASPQLHDMDALANMVDPNLKGIYPAKALLRCAEIISSCVQIEADSRPTMSEVVQSLVGLLQRTGSTKRMVSSSTCSPSTKSSQLKLPVEELEQQPAEGRLDIGSCMSSDVWDNVTTEGEATS